MAFWRRRLGARRLCAVLIKNQHSSSGSGIFKHNHSKTELEAGFILKKYDSISEIEAGLVQVIIFMCML